MSRKISTTVRLDPEDLAALERARKDGQSASELIRNGLRVVAARYYKGRRPPTTRLLVTSDAKLGAESELYRKLKDKQ
jgi:Arc/MetJ-type ribon-helix-helix transcriptional regulator